MGMSGLVILFSTLYPLISYKWELSRKYPVFLSPLAESEISDLDFIGKDYTKASNWFEGLDKEKFTSDLPSYYSISIPKLKIENAIVKVGGEDLSQNLIHYPGTALPGKLGNSVIFGHSVLPIFFNPKNYLSIFSTLYKLDKNDIIQVDIEGISYKYKVENIFEILPKDLQILEQTSSDSFITLVTCSPPGDPRKPKRLIVRARLISTPSAYADFRN